jgi:hypothetical protein
MSKIFKKTVIEFDGVRAEISPNSRWDGIVVSFFDVGNNKLTYVELDMKELELFNFEAFQMMNYVMDSSKKGN